MVRPRVGAPGESTASGPDPDALADDRLALTIAFGALMFCTVGVGQLLVDRTPGSTIPSIVAALTGIVLGAAAVILWRRPEVVTPRNARAMVTGTAIVVAANPVVYIVSTHIAYPALGTLLVIVAIGALVPYPRIAMALIVAMNVIALACAVIYPQAATVGTVALQLIKADLLALIIALTWRRTERRLHRATETIRQMAVTDELTGLLNRRGLVEDFAHLVADADELGRLLLVGFIDVDGLKETNDVRGHAAGDAVLAAVGRTLSSSMGQCVSAARIGGDEFAIVIGAIRGGADEVQESVNHKLESMPHSVTVGWAIREPGSATSLESLLDESDRAMRERRH